MNNQNEFSRKNWRAIYNAERDSFVVEQAGWVDGQPALEYAFNLLEMGTVYLAALEKCWITGDGIAFREPFLFAPYQTRTEFEVAVDQILEDARERAQSAGMDPFMAVIEIVKSMAVHAGLAEEEICEYVGLFEEGPEDAYTWCDDCLQDDTMTEIANSANQCWRLHTVRVVDLNREPLGWAVVVLRYPELSAGASDEEIASAAVVDMLEIEHWSDELTARLATQLVKEYMTVGVRFEDPELAELTDFTIFELLCVQFVHEDERQPVWDPLDPDLLQAIDQGEGELARDPARWYPRHTDLIQQFAAQMGLPTHAADQFEAFIRDKVQVTDEFDENSPWRYLDEEV